MEDITEPVEWPFQKLIEDRQARLCVTDEQIAVALGYDKGSVYSPAKSKTKNQSTKRWMLPPAHRGKRLAR